MKKGLFRNGRRIWLSVSADLILAFGITMMAILLQPNGFREMLVRFSREPLLFMMNYIPVLLCTVLLHGVFGNCGWGAAAANVLFCGLSLANRLKVQARDEALVPADFGLLREVGQAMVDYDLVYPLGLIVVALFITSVLVVAGVYWRRRFGKEKGLLRLGLSAVALLLLPILTLTVYASDTLYYSFDCTNSYYEARTYNEYGMPYSFFHNFTENRVDVPERFDETLAAQWDEAEMVCTGAPIHVIMIMSEAFTDLTDHEVFDFSEDEDPLRFFHSLQQDPNAITGRVVVGNFGAGTANTEFDVLTGIRSDALSGTTSSALSAVKQNMDSLFRVYGESGYRTEFLHPGYTWFYNRENAYRRMGADRAVFYEDLADKEMKGTWVTDDYVADRIIGSFEAAVDSGELLFQYVTTIQNHMAYTADKYGEGYDFPEVRYSRKLSEASETMLRVYTEGIRDADAMLEKLVSYFSDRQEPVLLAFWGDHYPNLGSSLACYEEMGMTDQETYPFDLYATPFAIWTNSPGAEVLRWQEKVLDAGLPEHGYLSACFLGALVTELTGHQSSWNLYLNELRREIPVVWWDSVYLDMDGSLVEIPDTTQQAMLEKWQQWSYYKMEREEISDTP